MTVECAMKDLGNVMTKQASKTPKMIQGEPLETWLEEMKSYIKKAHLTEVYDALNERQCFHMFQSNHIFTYSFNQV